MTTKAEPTPIEQMESAAQKYAAAESALSESIAEVHAEILAAKQKRRKEILRRAKESFLARERLMLLVMAYPELFKKPKTRVMHGIKSTLR